MAAEKKPDHNCRGCEKFEKCQARRNPETLDSLNVKRAPNREKYRVCHSIFPEVAARPPDPKETRRKFGESGVQY